VVLHGDSVYARGGDGSDPPQDPPLILAQSNGSDTGSLTSSTAPAFDGGTIFTVQQGALVAVATSGGRDRWSFGNGSLVTSPVVSDGVVFEGSQNGIVYGVSASTGRRVWSGRAGSVILGPGDEGPGVLVSMAVGDGLLVVPAGNQISAFG
jgi:outer membrane protein assembly factor BamB